MLVVCLLTTLPSPAGRKVGFTTRSLGIGSSSSATAGSSTANAITSNTTSATDKTTISGTHIVHCMLNARGAATVSRFALTGSWCTSVRRTTFIGPGGALLAFLAVVLVAVMFMCYSGKTNDGDAEPDQAGPARRTAAPAMLRLVVTQAVLCVAFVSAGFHPGRSKAPCARRAVSDAARVACEGLHRGVRAAGDLARHSRCVGWVTPRLVATLRAQGLHRVVEA